MASPVITISGLCSQFINATSTPFHYVVKPCSLRSPPFSLTSSLTFSSHRRAISFEHFTSSSRPIFFNLKILKLHDLFKLKLLSFIYDCVNKKSPSCFHSLFPLAGSVHQYGTRLVGKYDIYIIRKNTLQYGLRPVRYFGAKCWNTIPMHIKISPTVCSFRQQLKTFLLNNYQS